MPQPGNGLRHGPKLQQGAQQAKLRICWASTSNPSRSSADVVAAVRESQLHYEDGAEHKSILREPEDRCGNDEASAPQAATATSPMGCERFDSPACPAPSAGHCPVRDHDCGTPGFDDSAETWVKALAAYARRSALGGHFLPSPLRPLGRCLWGIGHPPKFLAPLYHRGTGSAWRWMF